MTGPRIEAAARALCERQGYPYDGSELAASCGFVKNWEAFADDAQAALAAADAAAWRLIDSAPEDTTILTYYRDGRVMADTFPYRGMLEWQEQIDAPPIFWPPLPAPPVQEVQE